MSARAIPALRRLVIPGSFEGSRVISLAGAIFLLAGCEVGPNYTRPATPAPDRFTETPLLAHTGTTDAAGGADQHFASGGAVPERWWTGFNVPALTELVDRALRENPSLETTRQVLTQAAEARKAAIGGLFPSVSAQLSRTREELSGAENGFPGGPSETFSVYGAQANVSYTFDVWGQTRRGIESAAAQQDAARFQLQGAATMLAANTATTAIQAASLRAQIDAEQALIAAERQVLATVRSQFELGGATGADVATQEAQLANTQALVVPLQTQLQQARDQLAAYVGRVPAEAALPSITLAELRLPADLPVSLPSSLVEQRPDIRASEARLQQANADLGVAISNRLPQVSLTAFIGSAPAQFADLFTPGNGTFSIANQILAPVFQGGTLLHRQRAAEAALRGAASAYQATVIDAFRNVADVLTALADDARALQANGDAERAARRSLELAQSQYKLGGAAYLTVLASQTQYQNAVIGLIRAQAARYTDTVALFAALGGGWWHI